jgi:hypothetical protein
MKLRTSVLLLSFFWAGVAMADMPEYINAPYSEQVMAWLNAHPSYRLAVEDDCQCKNDIESLRKGTGGPWKPQPSYEPYYATGDFNGDGQEDAAIVVVPKEKGQSLLVVVLFGKSRDASAIKPAEIPIAGDDLIERGLFVRASTSKKAHEHWKLLFGTFESEAEEIRIVSSLNAPSS